ncbi:RNA demethylase ALKBH10B-like [Wolffia australiana]
MAAAAGAVPFPEVFARDAIIAWFRGEFAAANAIIDALLDHLSQIAGGAAANGDYEAVFAAVHRRRMNWIPVLHLQKYFPIADVTTAIRRVAAKRKEESAIQEVEDERECDFRGPAEEISVDEDGEEVEERNRIVVDLPASSVAMDDAETEDDAGSSPASQGSTDNAGIWSDREDRVARPDRIKTVKGFVAKERAKGHMVNVVKGLKLYEDIFTDSELAKLTDFVRELRLSGRRGELSGSTFIYFNQQLKGNKREIIQLGTPIFQPTTDDPSSHIEPIPEVLTSVVDHLVQWRLIPENKRPNSCIINFFDEDEHSQPYFKPPHLENPVSTLVLSETTMAFGRFLVGDSQGVYKGSLSLSLKDGSLLVMRGNSADLARHVICPSSHRRITLTFVKVRSPESSSPRAPAPAVAVCKETSMPSPPARGPGVWGESCALQEMMVMTVATMPAMPPGRRIGRGGTGVFLPWTGGAKKYHKHVPPRIQRRRLALLPAPLEAAG